MVRFKRQALLLVPLLLSACGRDRVVASPADLRVAPGSLDFGRVALGRSASRVALLQNASRSPLEATLEVAPPFTVAPPALELAAGASLEVEVGFAPDRAGPSAGSLRVGWAGQALEVPLSGEGAELACPAPAPCLHSSLLADGSCVESPLPDGTSCAAPCVQNGTCLGGRCAGVLLPCDDQDACTLDACDPVSGCLSVPRVCPPPADACHVGLCDPTTGCAQAPVADGSACGPRSCSTALVCMAGQCVQRSTPAAASCIDALTAAYTNCALLAGGGVRCWGFNDHGTVGNGTSTPVRSSAVPVVGLQARVTAVSAGLYHSCAVADGAVKCWGSPASGKLGFVATADQLIPVTVPGLETGATSVASGEHHTCAVVNGVVWCWGDNTHGQLGDQTTFGRATPQPVRAGGQVLRATAVTAGLGFSCALGASGEVSCWGKNVWGVLGNGALSSSVAQPYPTRVSLGPGLTARAIASGGLHSCAVASDATVRCWGYDWKGQLGDGNSGTTSYSSQPVRAVGLSGAVAVSAGHLHTCAVDGAGAAWCWGFNTGYRLGDGTRVDRPVPTRVLGVSAATAIAAGQMHTCAAVAGGVRCWGNNGYGELGDGSSVAFSSAPVSVLGL